MHDFITLLIGYIGGCVAMWIICKPVNTWRQGYDSAKKFYGNYERGYHDGWKAAKKVHTNFALGFREGWDRAMKCKEVDSDDS